MQTLKNSGYYYTQSTIICSESYFEKCAPEGRGFDRLIYVVSSVE